MTQTHTSVAGPAGPGAPVGGNGQVPPPVAVAPPARRRPSRLLILGGLVLAAVCATGAVWVYQGASETVSAVGVAERVAYGQQISEGALVEVPVTPHPGVDPVAWEERGQLVGRVATTELHPGGLVTSEVVAGGDVPEVGSQLVGVAVGAGQAPATPLEPRQPVLLVPSSEGEGEAGEWEPVRGTVHRVGEATGGQQGQRVVDVLVAEGDGPELAPRASTGGVAIIVLPSGE